MQNPPRRLQLPSTWLSLAVALLVACSIGGLVLFEPPTGNIEILLIARDSGRPIKGATVVLEGPSSAHGKTDAEGRISFSSLLEGSYRVTAHSRGHLLPDDDPRGLVIIHEGRSETALLELSRRPSWLEVVLHHDLFYPGETPSFAVRGLTLLPSYQLQVYRLLARRQINPYELRYHPQAIDRALSLGEISLLSSREIRPANIDLEGVFHDRVHLDRLPVGEYVVVAIGETGVRSAELFTISRLGALVKSDHDQAVVYVTDLMSGQPIANAEVQASGLTTRTDTDGIARFAFRSNITPHVNYRIQSGEDVVNLSAALSYWSREPYRLYWFTDRTIYRPGDTIQFKGVLRRKVGDSFELSSTHPVKMTVTDPSGMEIFKEELPLNDQGSFSGSFTVSTHGRTGSYLVNCSIGEFTDTSVVSVASYLKPELQLTAQPAQPYYPRGQLATVNLEAAYYFGAPAPKLDIRWTLTRDIYYPPFDSFGEMNVFDYEMEYYGGELVAEGRGTTNTDGRLQLTLPTRLPADHSPEADSPYRDHVYTLHIWSASEAGGAAETTARFLVTRGDFFLQAIPERYVLTPGENVGIKLAARDFDGNPVANQTIDLSVISESQPQRNRPVERQTISTSRLTTGADGTAATAISLPREGEFILEALARDARGREIALRQHLWVAGEAAAWRFWEGQSDLTIVPDKRQYQEGQRARLLVTAQREGPALFCVEGERLYEVRSVYLQSGANLIDLELLDIHVPNVYVWIGQVYGKRLRQAQAEISVSRETRRLTVRLEPGRPNYLPGESASCAITVTDDSGNPVQAELALGVVDEAIYALAPDRLPNPADFFHARRYNKVNTSFFPASRYFGGGDKAPTELDVRRKFVDTAFWAPHLLTDDQGRAHIQFPLPDNLTSWRITARALTTDTHGGQATANFTVSKPLMVRLDLPRFSVHGDRFRVSAYLHNETDQPKQVTLRSWTTGLDLDAREERLTLPARQVVRRDWWAVAAAAGQATLGAAVVSGELQDAVELPLTVSPRARLQFDAWSGRTEGRENLIISVREDSPQDLNRLSITLAPSLATSLFSSLEYLIRYPYGCTEQVISSFLPNLYVERLLHDRGLSDLPIAREIPPLTREGLSRLSSLTRDDGGWGWGRWGELDIWMTAYALLALQEAQRAGYQTMDTSYALYQLENSLRLDRSEYPDDLAFVAYVLARYRSELAVQTITRALALPKLSGRGRALCVLALFELDQTLEAERQMREIWRTAKREGDWLYWTGLQDEASRWWDGGVNIEATAWSLQAALRSDRSDPRVASIAGWLLAQRRGDYWVSTRDTAVSLFALSNYLRTISEPNPDYTAVVSLNGTELRRHRFTRDPSTWRELTIDVPPSLLRTGANQLKISREEGSGLLYYSANMRQAVLIREGERIARGDVFQIRREYFKLTRGRRGDALAFGPAARPGTSFADSDQILVRLTINSSQRLRYVLLEDFFPAGLEPTARGDIGFMDWRSWWVDNDVRDDRVTFYLDWLPAGERTIEYLLTARTPGRFHALPPNGFPMYQPTINSLGEVSRLEVK